ncbi:ABC transporter ATP-binding protein [Motiliproteus sp.]|uniref:ABC transporter ATP-binding protein n=1 Tax=Motiliproteus sp. TaxID=1898955 RepID=UPI003BADA7DF
MLAFFERLTQPFPPEEPGQPPRDIYAFCRHYTRGMERSLLWMTLLTATLAILEVSLFGFMGQLVDWLGERDPQTLFEQEGLRLLGMALLVLLVIPALVFLHSAFVHQALLGNYPMAVRWLAHRYLLGQSVSFYQDDFAGRLATKVMQTALSVREAVMKLLNVLMYVLVYLLSMLVLLAQADYRLMLPMLIWLVGYIGLQLYYIPKLKRVATEQADARSTMTGRVVDSYTNIATVKLFAHTRQEADYAQEGMEEFMDTVYRQMRLATGINVGVQISNYLLAFVISVISIWLWSIEAVSIGAIAIAVSLALRLNGMSQWIMWEVSMLFEHIGTVADGMATLAQPREVQDRPGAPALKVSSGQIDFDQIRFHYGKGEGVIEQLNLNIRPGEKVGLVGRSGAGKSTLVNLLLRFYDLEGGKIRIDGQDISAVQQETLRAQIGMVTQDTALLHRSVRENILYGRPDASEQALIDAAVKAEAHGFIQQLADPKGNQGYDAQVGERGVKLSGGQRQRIAIARALLKDAPILVLDEATSALDSEVEAAIQHSLQQLMQGKTVIAIAHRLSTIAAMDRLIVLDQGRIVEQGTHQELVNNKGIYAQLWAHQTGGFLGTDPQGS